MWLGSLDQIFTKKNILWASTSRMPEMERACIAKFEAARHSKEGFPGKILLEVQHLFLYKPFNFLTKLNHHKISLFNARGLKLGHFVVFDMLFPFVAFFKL